MSRTAHVLPAAWRQYLVDSDPRGVESEVILACDEWHRLHMPGICRDATEDAFDYLYDGTNQPCLVYIFKTF